jgi:hypothetical protein
MGQDRKERPPRSLKTEMSLEAVLVDDLVELAVAGADDAGALAAVRRWTREHDHTSVALTRALDVAFGRLPDAPSVEVLLAVVGWLEASHPLWGIRL